MSVAMAAILAASGVGLVAATYLHAASRYLDRATVNLHQLPALCPIYYRMLVSLLTKPRRLKSARTTLPAMRITTGARNQL